MFTAVSETRPVLKKNVGTALLRPISLPDYLAVGRPYDSALIDNNANIRLLPTIKESLLKKQ